MTKKQELFKYIKDEKINIHVTDLWTISNIIDELIEETVKLNIRSSPITLKDEIYGEFESYVNEYYTKKGDIYVCKQTGVLNSKDDVLRFWHHQY